MFSLWETSQTLFWAIFGLIDLDNFELTGIKEFTRFSGLLMFGSFSVINIIVLLNLLIAMMNHSYQLISVSSVSREVVRRCGLSGSGGEEGAPPPLPPPQGKSDGEESVKSIRVRQKGRQRERIVVDIFFFRILKGQFFPLSCEMLAWQRRYN